MGLISISNWIILEDQKYIHVFPGINVGAVFSIADDDIPHHNKKYKETAVTFNIHGNPFQNKIDDLLFRWLNSMKNESNLDQFWLEKWMDN